MKDLAHEEGMLSRRVHQMQLLKIAKRHYARCKSCACWFRSMARKRIHVSEGQKGLTKHRKMIKRKVTLPCLVYTSNSPEDFRVGQTEKESKQKKINGRNNGCGKNQEIYHCNWKTEKIWVPKKNEKSLIVEDEKSYVPIWVVSACKLRPNMREDGCN